MQTKKMKKGQLKDLLRVFKRYEINKEFDYCFLKNGKNVFAVSKEIYQTLPINLYKRETGLFVGWFDDKDFIFTIEGAQLIGKYSNNVLDLDKKDLYYWMHGQNFVVNSKNGYYLIRFNDNIVGWAKVRDNTLLNNVNKERVVFRL